MYQIKLIITLNLIPNSLFSADWVGKRNPNIGAVSRGAETQKGGGKDN